MLHLLKPAQYFVNYIENNYPGRLSITLSGVVLFMLFFYLLVDSINGVIIRDGGYSISAVYKFMMLIMILYVIRDSILFSGIALSVIVYFIIHSLGNNTPLESIVDMSFLVKFFSIMIFFGFFRKIMQEGKSEKIVYYFSLVSFLILAMNLLLGLAGYGYTQYRSGEIGTRGFIYSGNELAGALVVSSSIVLMYLMKSQKFFRYISFGIVFIFMALLTATKVAILSSLLVFMFFPLISLVSKSHHLRIPKKETYFVLLVLLLFPVVSYISIYYVLYKVNLLERLSHFYERADFVTFILSGRNERVSDAISSYMYDYTIIEWFFGRAGDVISEVDTVDVLMKYGVIGVFIIYGFFTYWIIVCLKSSSAYEYRGYVAFMILLLLMISTTAGHIVYSGMAGPLIAALLSMAVYRKTVECRRYVL